MEPRTPRLNHFCWWMPPICSASLHTREKERLYFVTIWGQSTKLDSFKTTIAKYLKLVNLHSIKTYHPCCKNWEIQDQCSRRFGVWEYFLSALNVITSFVYPDMEGGKKSLLVLLKRSFSFRWGLSLWPSHLPMAPPFNVIALRLRFQYRCF